MEPPDHLDGAGGAERAVVPDHNTPHPASRHAVQKYDICGFSVRFLRSI